MTEPNVDAGMAGVAHPTRASSMGRPDLPAETRPGSFLVDIVAGMAVSGAFDYRGATVAEMERGSMPSTPEPAMGREQARWLEADDEPGHEVRR